MGATPVSLRCSRCKRGRRGDLEDFGRHLLVLGHEIKVTPARASHGAGSSHRAIVQCLDCGRVMRSTHPSVAVNVWSVAYRNRVNWRRIRGIMSRAVRGRVAVLPEETEACAKALREDRERYVAMHAEVKAEAFVEMTRF